MKLPVRRTDGDPGTQGPKSHPPRPGAQEAEALQQEPRQHRGGGGGPHWAEERDQGLEGPAQSRGNLSPGALGWGATPSHPS